jgi:hypothetical protein
MFGVVMQFRSIVVWGDSTWSGRGIPVNFDQFVHVTGIKTYYPVLLGRLTSGLDSFSYHYMPIADYKHLGPNLRESMRVYWFEILERGHCASLLALLRLHRWLEAMRMAAEFQDFLGFAASFRGLLESAADSQHALGDVPNALAAAFPYAYEAVHGRAEALVLAPDLEDDLIHFSHARKLGKGEGAPETHAAKAMKEYLTSLQGAASGNLHDAYAELCNITHPAADSLLYLLVKGPDGSIAFSKHADEQKIQDLCGRGATVVTYCVSESMIYPAVILRIVNRFELPGLHTPAAEEVSLEYVQLWADNGPSVLEHLLGEAATIPEDRGVFLERSFRMHPDVCAFISEIVYARRLHSADSAARRTTSFGTGIRFVPVDHQGNRAASDEEVAQIANQIRDMLRGSFTDADGTTRPLREHDFMVVAPYNAQVRRLRAGLPAGVRVGTVDKFQGQEAPIVFFSMATSSGEDVPRNLAFLFSRNRLNVAISRAQCLAVLVCSPRLLEARCDSIEEMALVNALCRLVEYAEGTAV